MTSDQLDRLFRIERAAAPPTSAVEQGWHRLARDLASNVAPMPIATGPLKAGVWLVPKWILAGFALGLIGSGVIAPVLSAKTVPVSASQTAPGSTEVGSVVPVASPMAAASAVAPPAAMPSSVTRVAPMLAQPVAAVAPSASARTTFDAELALVTLAKAELDARHFGPARAALDEHAARFPAGVFATEREALSVLVSCEGEAKNPALAKKFGQQHPASPLTARLEQACGTASAPRGASADFSNLANGAAVPGEPTSEPGGGERK